jgi:hypothetical protein
MRIQKTKCFSQNNSKIFLSLTSTPIGEVVMRANSDCFPGLLGQNSATFSKNLRFISEIICMCLTNVTRVTFFQMGGGERREREGERAGEGRGERRERGEMGERGERVERKERERREER